ncbi:MAG: EAL domain-containing protein [Sphingomonadales bacterium]|nr:EAL domain-containing protein [Sphingomonadales bacterium]MBD3775241.1 EAL domain-containing protein [Paracoccaceae bacterium]
MPEREGEAPSRGRRRSSAPDAAEVAVNDLHYMLPRNWSLMATYFAAAYVFVAIVNFVMPDLDAVVAAVVSVGFAAAGNRVARIEREGNHPLVLRLAMLFAVVVVPMAALGWAFADLASDSGLDWRWGLSALISLNCVAIALLTRRLVGLFSSLVACWTAVALFDGSFEAIGALLAGVAVIILVALYQYRREAARLEDEQEEERIRRRAEDILRDYEETGQGWFWETDRRGNLTYVSDSVAEIIGKRKSAIVGRPFAELFDLNEENREGERTFQFHMSARSAFHELSVRAAVSREERYWSISGRPIYDSFHNYIGFRGSGTDLTEKKRSQEQASRLAHYDSLTGLANRHQMSQSLEKILASPQQMQRECSVFLLDLDRFKQVNDTLGHPAGDALLKQVAGRLQRTVGRLGRVGRLGGDEFEVIVPGRTERDRLGALAQEIIQSLSQPYSIEGQRVVIGASVGISVAPEHGDTSEEIIRNADLALYAAKDGGRGRFHFYASDLHSAAEERSRLEQDLRDAVTEGHLELHYQPVVLTSTERITGFEALLRWHHPTRGWVSPAEFIPVAEDTGLIAAIGEWAIRTACADLAEWPEEVRCAVNVSPLQFSNPNLPAIITNALAHSGVDPSRLELEITESVFLTDDKGTDAMFAALKGIGVRLALDDFGTGYSSLGYLKKAPFDKIKIDQSFVRGATVSGSRNGAIIASIVSLAQALGMDTTAEGVETFDELDLVRMHGCSHVQGYIYEKPLAAAAATARLKTGLASVAQGPRSARASRQSMLRKIVLEHGGQYYNGTIRNISTTGAMIEGLWNVPVGTIFTVALSDAHVVTATTRWCQEDRMGVEFAVPLERDQNGAIVAVAGGAGAPGTRIRRAGS